MISPATSKTGAVLFARLEPGTELRWGRMAAGPDPADLFVDEYRYVVHNSRLPFAAGCLLKLEVAGGWFQYYFLRPVQEHSL